MRRLIVAVETANMTETFVEELEARSTEPSARAKVNSSVTLQSVMPHRGVHSPPSLPVRIPAEAPPLQ